MAGLAFFIINAPSPVDYLRAFPIGRPLLLLFLSFSRRSSSFQIRFKKPLISQMVIFSIENFRNYPGQFSRRALRPGVRQNNGRTLPPLPPFLRLSHICHILNLLIRLFTSDNRNPGDFARGQFWPGGLKLNSIEVSDHRGGMLKF